jgi:hypothetical protein
MLTCCCNLQTPQRRPLGDRNRVPGARAAAGSEGVSKSEVRA